MMEKNKNISEKDLDKNQKFDESVRKDFLPYLKDLAVVLCIILVVFLFCFRIAVVDGDSMQDTLTDGDYVLLLNRMISGAPEYGDIVVISTNSYSNGKPIIKRVIATEGQVVDIDFESGTVSVDGVILDEPYIKDLTKRSWDGVSYPLTVEEGCIFVMGDNRMNSTDSRCPIIGQIDCREVIGKAFFRIFPGDDHGKSERDFSTIGAIS